MLLEFKVSNFRSFGKEQIFSLIADRKDQSHADNLIDITPTKSKTKTQLLKSAAIYGPNASGKSNLCKAFGFFSDFIISSATRINLEDPIPKLEPFRLDSKLRKLPSTFEIDLLINDVEYQYGFAATRRQVHEEWLFSKPRGGRKSRPLWRKHDEKSGTTNWVVRGLGKKDQQFITSKTRANGLFLSRAAEMNVEIVKDLYSWFNNNMYKIDMSARDLLNSFKLTEMTSEIAFQVNDFKEHIESLIRDADLGIEGIELEKKKMTLPDSIPVNLKRFVSSIAEFDADSFEVTTMHTSRDTKELVRFSLVDDESMGTLRYYSLLGAVLKVLLNGDILIVDELDCSLHPHLTRNIVEMFHSEKLNRKGAQLIFTTHDSSLMSSSLFRRDQIWFTEKNNESETELFSLLDIEKTPRSTSAFERNYHSGRYGAIPQFGPVLENLKIE